MEKVELPDCHSFHWRHANPLQFASERLPNGTLKECINKNPLVNRIDLVSLSCNNIATFVDDADFLSCQMLPKASPIFKQNIPQTETRKE